MTDCGLSILGAETPQHDDPLINPFINAVMVLFLEISEDRKST